MDDILGDLQPKYAVAYVNDITIFIPIMEQHVIDVEKVFECLDCLNLKVNVRKCKFAMDEVKVLGHIISFKGILPDLEKVKIIQTLPLSKNVTSVKSFLGVINFFRKFIINGSKLIKPLIFLICLRKKNNQINWT